MHFGDFGIQKGQARKPARPGQGLVNICIVKIKGVFKESDCLCAIHVHAQTQFLN